MIRWIDKRGGLVAFLSVVVLAGAFLLASGVVQVGQESGSGFLSRLSIATTAQAQMIYYDVIVKLVWDDVYNVDLYVKEPSGEVASAANSVTGTGGEIGYYDEDGEEWTGGDGDGTVRRETYRQRTGVLGTYEITVRYRDASVDDIVANVFTLMFSETQHQVVESYGPQEMGPDDDVSEWDAGEFTFSGLSVVERPSSKGCFIATAAFGSPMQQNVATLCAFRDRYLETNAPGRLFVRGYEWASPPAATFISAHPALKPVVRVALLPAVGVSSVAVEGSSILKWSIAGALFAVCGAVVLVRKRRRQTSKK